MLRPGDILQCSSGHDVLKAKSHLGRGSTISAGDFEACKGVEPPVNGRSLPTCPQCGEEIFQNPTGYPVKIKRNTQD